MRPSTLGYLRFLRFGLECFAAGLHQPGPETLMETVLTASLKE